MTRSVFELPPSKLDAMLPVFARIWVSHRLDMARSNSHRMIAEHGFKMSADVEARFEASLAELRAKWEVEAIAAILLWNALGRLEYAVNIQKNSPAL